MDKEWQKPQILRAILVGRRPAGLADITLRDLAVGVFLFPGQVLVATRAFGNWRRPVVLLLLAGVLCGLLTGLASYPGLYRDTVEWATWFGGTVGEFRITDTKFAWQRPEQLPFTTRCKRFRVDFADDTTAFAPQQASGDRESRGVWITPTRVRLWWLVRTGWFFTSETDVAVKSTDITDVVHALGRAAGQERLAGERFGEYARQVLTMGAPLFLVGNCIAMMLPVMLYTWLFTLMAMVLRRGELAGGFASVFAVNVLCAVPSMCVAGIYAALRLPALDFHRVFILAFFLYITMAFASVRRLLAEA